jgi:CheY-like chemotaxis protein
MAEPTDLNQILPEVLDLVRPLAAQQGISLEATPADALPSLAVHPVALNQMLLNLLTIAISQATGKQVTISTRSLQWEAEVEVQTKALTAPQCPTDEEALSLEMARQLADLCGCRLTTKDAMGFSAVLALPVVEGLPVLAVDDNADTLRLLQHYVAGTRYRLFGTQDPEQILSLVKKYSPQIIVIDVMMPQVDGWKVLGRLRQHPLTHHIPVVVCTVLTQEALALSLGASALIHKPVTQHDFLVALDRQVALLESGRH